jgi:hypothetical protein
MTGLHNMSNTFAKWMKEMHPMMLMRIQIHKA